VVALTFSGQVCSGFTCNSRRLSLRGQLLAAYATGMLLAAVLMGSLLAVVAALGGRWMTRDGLTEVRRSTPNTSL
jgi:hypothetical protein